MAGKGGARPGAGRKKGTLNKATASVRVLAQKYTEDAIKALVSVMTNPDSPAPAVTAAAVALLDRGHGRPSQAMTHTFKPWDLSKFDDDELAFVERIGGKLALAGSGSDGDPAPGGVEAPADNRTVN